MKKFYLMLMAVTMVFTAVSAQTNGYYRLANANTGHVTHLASAGSFAPNATMEDAHSLPGTVAYLNFEDDKVTQLRAQGIDVANVAIPMLKQMLLTTIDETNYYALRDSAVNMVSRQMSGAMGSMVVRLLKDFTYADFVAWTDKIDTNLYMEKHEDVCRLYMITPNFPLNGGAFNSYIVSKANQLLKTYIGTFQERADEYLTGDKEGLRPMAYSFISHLQFGDRMYLTEQNHEEYGTCFGFANNSDVDAANAAWMFLPVDEGDYYFGLAGQCEDAEGHWYASFAADFPIQLGEGMKAYVVTDEMDPAHSQIKWQAVEEDIIPAMTPVIVRLNGDNPDQNKVRILDGNYAYQLDGNILQLAANEMGFLVGKTLDEPDPHHYVLGVRDGKLSMVSTVALSLNANEAYLYLDASRKSQNPTDYMALVDQVDAICEVTAVEDTPAYYDLQGRRINHPTKGIYIVNGKKVVRW